MTTEPQIVHDRVFYVIACVPKGWTDAQVEGFVTEALPRASGFLWQVQTDVPRIECAEDCDNEHVKVLA